MKKFILLIVALLLQIACQGSFQLGGLDSTPTLPASSDPLEWTPTAVQFIPSSELPTATLPPDVQRLSMLLIENAQFNSPLWGTFHLTNGIYYRTPNEPNASPDVYSTKLFDSVAYGDLNTDRIEDAVVILQTHNGGNGDTKELAALLNQNGQPYNVSTVDIGSPVAVEGLQIQSGEIIITVRTLGPNDPLCCPSQLTTLQFRLQNGQLINSK
ncbi:MAG: hypothetical protein HYR70_03445 [Chloroflexi bacterium]|nr:hypothetical protein [Chloroflexota bacterium]MBI3340612.1 hypothetical protein [Chloroflexota bacterium]